MGELKVTQGESSLVTPICDTPQSSFWLYLCNGNETNTPEYSFRSLNISLCKLRKDHKSCKPFHAFFFPNARRLDRVPGQLRSAALWPWQVQPNTWGWAGITPHLLGAHKPCSHAQPQVFHSPLRPIALENRNREKGVPVAGDVPHFPQRRLQLSRGALGRGAALNFYRAAPKPQGTAQALQPGMGSLLPVLHPTLTSSSLEGSAQTQNRVMRTERRTSCLMLLKKQAAASLVPPQKLFSFGGWGCQAPGICTLHSQVPATGVDWMQTCLLLRRTQLLAQAERISALSSQKGDNYHCLQWGVLGDSWWHVESWSRNRAGFLRYIWTTKLLI